MRLKKPGKSTSKAEVVSISHHGVWIYVNRTEYFLPFTDFPWFADATVSQIHNLKLLNRGHLHWPDLDVDLELESLENLEMYPLVYK